MKVVFGVFKLLSLLAAIAAALFSPAHSAQARVSAPQSVSFDGYAPGTIVVRTQERSLYYVVRRGTALRYPVGVGKSGKSWSGTRHVDGKYIRPAWSPPPEIRRDNPHLPKVIPGGSPRNPMGAAALTLSGGEYAIHGTNSPRSIGGYVSYGCIRMHNAHVMDLYRRVKIGARVVVVN